MSYNHLISYKDNIFLNKNNDKKKNDKRNNTKSAKCIINKTRNKIEVDDDNFNEKDGKGSLEQYQIIDNLYNIKEDNKRIIDILIENNK